MSIKMDNQFLVKQKRECKLIILIGMQLMLILMIQKSIKNYQIDNILVGHFGKENLNLNQFQMKRIQIHQSMVKKDQRKNYTLLLKNLDNKYMKKLKDDKYQLYMIVPQIVNIGTLNPKLEEFDDSKQIIKAGGMKKIQAIRVFYTDNYVRGFEIFYKLNAGDFLKAVHNVPKKRKELHSAVFEIGPDDYLSEIMGAYQSAKKNKIVHITFITYRGKVQGFGGKGDQSFRFCYPGSTFGAFKGGFKKQVEWLEIQVYPLPEEFKQEMQKLGILKIQQVNQIPDRSSSNCGQPVVFVPKVQVAKPIIAVPVIVPQMNQQTGYSNPQPYSQPPQQPNYFPQPQYPGQQQQSQSFESKSQYPTFNQPTQPYNPYK